MGPPFTITSPSLIDFTVRHPRQTLLDSQESYGFPSPVRIDEPYRDNFSDSSSEDARSEGEKEVEKLLDVAPRSKRPNGKRVGSATDGQGNKDTSGRNGTGEGDGCFSITLPDGSNISFRPPASNGPSADSVSQRPVIAQGFEQAFEAIKRLAVGNGTSEGLPNSQPAATQKSKKRNALHLPIPSVPKPTTAPKAVKLPKVTKSLWPILSPLSHSPPSKLVPTAPAFRPCIRSRAQKAHYLVPPSPSTSPSPPLSNYTDNPLIIDSSRTTSPDRNPPIVISDGPDTKPVILTSPSQLQSLFAVELEAIPWNKVDFPFQHRLRKKARTTAPTGKNLVHVPQTAEEINKKLDAILRSFDPPKPVLPKSAPLLRKENQQELQKALQKVRATREPLASNSLNPVATSWNPSANAFQPKRPFTTKLVDIDIVPPSTSGKYSYTPAPSIVINDPPSPAKSRLDAAQSKRVGKMNGVSIDDWKEEVQDVNSYFDDLDRKEKRNTVARADPIPTARLIDVSEYTQTINKTRTKVIPAALPFTPYDRLLSLPSARATVPRHLCTSKDELQVSLMRSWIAAEPTDDQKHYVKNLSALLTRMVDQEWGRGAGARDQRFTVDVFGSVSWGGETGRGGDVDMVIRDSYYPQGYHPALWNTEEEEPVPRSHRNQPRVNIFRVDLSPVYDLHNVVYLLRRKGFAEVFGIYGATTPIAKFKDPTRPGVEADVNVNDLGGWYVFCLSELTTRYNSRLILAYCEISPHVLRPLIHCLKLWAKANHVNDPSGKYGMPTMSSYCLTLMAIGYLQHCGVLTNLQEDVEVRIPDFPETEGKDVIWAGWGKSTGTKINVGFAERPKEGWMSANPNMTVAEAVRGFFIHFSRTGSGRAFQYNTQVVSILNGGMLDRAKTQGQETQEAQARKAAGLAPLTREEMVARESMMGKGDQGIQPRNWSERRLVVQDPFIWQKNCTQSMSKQGLDRWMSAVDRTYQSLTLNHDKCSLDTLLASCLPPPPLLPPRHNSNGGAESRTSRDQMYRSAGGGEGTFGQIQRGVLPTRPSNFGRTLYSPR